MNKETNRIYQMLESTFNGDPWHGSSVMQILTDVFAGQASAKPIAQAHSIWELVLHITAWRTFTWEKIRGNASYDISSTEQDWPIVENTDEQTWQQALLALRKSQQNLLEILKGLEDDKLDSVVSGRSYTFYVLLQGIIQHDLYHAGQIAILKKPLS